MGWALIGVACLNMVVNMAIVAFETAVDAYYKMAQKKVQKEKDEKA